MQLLRALAIGSLMLPFPTYAQEEESEAESTEVAPAEEFAAEEGLADQGAADGAAEPAGTEEPHPLSLLKWIAGPTEVEVGNLATLAVPKGYMFLHPGETKKFQDFVENPSNGRESLIAPDDLRWFGLLEFDEIGYVKDDEEIDAGNLLDSIKEGTKIGNEERRQRGWAELKITGWRFEPRYDAATNRLEWAIEAVSENQPVVNFNTRLLGRKGVTSATLVAEPATLDAAVSDFKDVLTGFAYVSGERYADMQEGDRMAEYGLAALIAGGGAAVAAKSGLLKSLWKVLAAAGVAVAVWLGKIFKGRKQRDA
ncbi:MAG: DUF2167 domain-containing protein [Gammaproteobacteria bacterium]